MTKREQRVINAFVNCVRHGEMTEDYAITILEDNARYGWLSDAAKDAFYDALEPVPEPETDDAEQEADAE